MMSDSVEHPGAAPSLVINLRAMTVDDSEKLAALVEGQPLDYLAHFTPFAMSSGEWRARLAAAEADRYWVIVDDSRIAGFFMLRGWDEGYSRPSFGIFVGARDQGKGLAKAALDHAIAWCQSTKSATSIMLKVHSGNTAARSVYEAAGFRDSGLCPDTGHMIMTLDLSDDRPSS
jgi:RimJ/RimL family protein N-acetyltransferase